jgi:hypothetical protein
VRYCAERIETIGGNQAPCDELAQCFAQCMRGQFAVALQVSKKSCTGSAQGIQHCL